MWQPSQFVRPCVPSRAPPSGQLESVTTGHTTLSQASNEFPSRSMASMIIARRGASATRAFHGPRRLAILRAQLLSAKLCFVRVRIVLAAS